MTNTTNPLAAHYVAHVQALPALLLMDPPDQTPWTSEQEGAMDASLALRAEEDAAYDDWDRWEPPTDDRDWDAYWEVRGY